jgi:sulfatase maturation enzyme AslB (radical SAM superfamily)
MSNEINKFYLNTQKIKPIVENSAVNVIYFTNRCNLACTYCYEDLKNKEKEILTREKIIKSVDEILEKEDKDTQTLFVLFGGEVTLEWENAVFCMEYAYSKKQNVHFNICSNGIKFLNDDFLKSYKKLFFVKNGLCTLDISFDGIGNSERVFHNGEVSTYKMLELFKKLNNNKIKYRIRYTIQKLNIKNLYDDLNNIIKFIKPDRIITSIAWSTLTKEQLDYLKEVKNILRFDWMENKINTPICEFFCDMCNGCGVQKEFKSYYSNDGNINKLKNSDNAGKFSDFKIKEKDE